MNGVLGLLLALLGLALWLLDLRTQPQTAARQRWLIERVWLPLLALLLVLIILWW